MANLNQVIRRSEGLKLIHAHANYEGNFDPVATHCNIHIQLLESPIPAPAAAAVSQKASSDDISGTKRGSIDPLVSKRPEKILKKKLKIKREKKLKNWSKTVIPA